MHDRPSSPAPPPTGPGHPPSHQPIRQFAADRQNPLPEVDKSDSLTLGFIRMILGTVGIYSALFASGWWLFDQPTPALTATVIAVVCSVAVLGLLPQGLGPMDALQRAQT